MKHIVVKGDFAFLYFNKHFYTKEKVKLSVKEYKDFVKSSFSEVGNYFVVKVNLISQDYPLNYICDEIFNHVLASENGNK